ETAGRTTRGRALETLRTRNRGGPPPIIGSFLLGRERILRSHAMISGPGSIKSILPTKPEWQAPSENETASITQAAQNPDKFLIKLDRPPYGFEGAKGVSIGAEPAGKRGYSIAGKLYYTSGGGFGPMGPRPVQWFQVKAP